MLEEILFKGIKKPKERKRKEIQQTFRIEGEEIPKLESFDQLKVKPIYDTPRLVQQLVIPYILQDKNVSVQSFTGSGKTLSFILPLLELGLKKKVEALILVPTDQLITQVSKVMEEVRELALRKGMDTSKTKVLICKPEDLGTYPPASPYTHLIIDEADLMVNKDSLGLFKVLDKFLDFQSATVCVFSATLNKEVENILGMLKDFSRIYVSNKNSLSHKFVFGTRDNIKHLALGQVIDDGVEAPCLVFVDDLETGRKLSQRIPNSALFEGQEDVLDLFRLKKIWFLFTTDVLSRGVDFLNTRSVINFDFPPSRTAFVHRAGRVNRNTTGQKVITLYTIEDFERLHFVVEFLKENGCKVEEHIEKIINKKK